MLGIGLLALLVAAPAPAAPAARATLPGYDLDPRNAVRHVLPAALHEISGLAVTREGRVFAHGDEQAVVFELDPRTGAIRKHFRLGAPRPLRGDFEGIAVAGERFFLVTSDGVLFEFREGKTGESVRFRRIATPLAGRCEVEGLAHDRATDALLLACKTTQGAALRERVVVFAFSLQRMQLEPQPRLAIPFRALAAHGLQAFHPASIEVHPSGTLYLVSAREEAIVEAARDGRILAVRKLSSRVHPQTEGLSFTPGGSLLLADEGRDGSATLHVYPLRAAPRSERRSDAPAADFYALTRPTGSVMHE